VVSYLAVKNRCEGVWGRCFCLLNCLFLKKALDQYSKDLDSISLEVRRNELKSSVGSQLVMLSRSSFGSCSSFEGWDTRSEDWDAESEPWNTRSKEWDDILISATMCVWCSSNKKCSQEYWEDGQ